MRHGGHRFHSVRSIYSSVSECYSRYNFKNNDEHIHMGGVLVIYLFLVIILIRAQG